tara:strand:+ start:132 stop:494 length:363 start_codon:yes stop_codon:yes gene_type:complete
MSQGHWRKLPAHWTGEGRFGEQTRGKTWVDTEKSESADKAKSRGKIPPLQAFNKQGDFIFFAAPGGRFVFMVHQSEARKFATLTSGSGWTESSELKKFMQTLEQKAKFGIFETEKPVLGY